MTLPVTLASTSFVALIEFAKAGHEIASLPYFAIADALMAGSLREVLPNAERRTRAMRLLWPRSKFPSAEGGCLCESS
ncbi:LysR substrate-binding domain-containing protein [Bradyrhizobium ottawaense]|uniref:LysR substrate-binding domain-containing protein n=1 Tax=Bradyrhizobium ottawaense TaxID=931866 RepID=UPI0009B7D926|nr:LysR substrate-binding domain-containing protein [Bradyrhizobium ottawaense]